MDVCDGSGVTVFGVVSDRRWVVGLGRDVVAAVARAGF